MIFHHVAGLVIFLTIVNTKKRFPVISNEPELVSKGFGYSGIPFVRSFHGPTLNRENFHDSIFNTYVAMLIQHDGFSGRRKRYCIFEDSKSG